MRKRSNTIGRINKKKTGNTATANLKRSFSDSRLVKRRKPLVTLKKGMLNNLLPKKLASSINGNVRKDIFLLESPDKSYDSVFWRDSGGSKMFITLEKNNGPETSDNILKDLEQVSQNKDQDILSQDNKLPSTLIIDTDKDKAADAKQLARQLIADYNAQNGEGKQYKVDQIQEKNLDNNSVGLTISISETDLNQPRQDEFDDLDSDDIIIQPKDFKDVDEIDEQELAIQVSSDSSDDDSSQVEETRQNVNINPIINLEDFKQKMPGGLIRSREYKAIIKKLEEYHNIKKEYNKRLRKEGDSDGLYKEYHKKLLDTSLQLASANNNYLNRRSQVPGKRQAVTDLTDQISTLNDGNLSKELENIRGLIPEPHRLTRPLEKFNTDTASEVYIATTKGNIEGSNTNKGYAKKAVKKDDFGNDATGNLGFAANGQKLENEPNLIARQVLSYRVAKAFGSNLIAPETFSTDAEGTTIGITAEVANATQAMKNVVDEQGKEIQEHTIFSFSKAKTQKDLADLQIIDAINGQLDRHLGNIFINKDTGEVVTIDQDQSHPLPRSTKFSPVAETNNTLVEQFERNKDGKLVYKQEQVDAETAEKIIAMEPDKLKKILEGNPNDPERLDPEAINHTIERFIAVKTQVLNLKKEGKLINNWSDTTFQESLDKGTVPGPFNSTLHNNYVARAVLEFEGAKTNPAKKQVF